jgi:hypothetical protein
MPIPRRNRRAVGQTIAALRAGGLLEKSDQAICVLAQASADLLDQELAYGSQKLYALSGMLRTHLLIVEALVTRATADVPDDGYSELLATLRTPPLGWTVGNGDAPEAFQ